MFWFDSRTMGPVYMDHYPAGASTKSFVHFAQLYNDPGSFAQYDYEDPEQVEMQKSGSGKFFFLLLTTHT